MNTETIFTVKNEHLDLLTEDTAVEFFKRLLWAEAQRLGPGTCKINVPDETKIPDGGIDATVDTCSRALESDIIASGKNCYQIRSGTGFKPWRDGDVRKELLKKGSPKDPEKKHLRESIKDCLDECGTYVLVCTGIDSLVPPNRKKAFNLIKDYLEKCGNPDAKVDVWPQNILIRFLKTFPALSLWVNGRDSAKFQTHDSWSRDANMQGQFISGESQDKLIESLRIDLRCDNNTNPVLVSGHPGIGKTRLVLEATNTKDLAPLVIYSPADQFLQDKFLMDELCNSDSDLAAIVVIDDCNLHSRSEILNKLKFRGPKIKLITIYNNHEETAGDISPYVPERLNDEQICSIISQYTKSSDTSDRRWVELCSGSPRVAHVVGWNLANYPQDVLNPLSTINIWERYVVSVDDPSQERTEQRRRVLRYMALFKQFGFENTVGKEAKTVAKKIEEADPQITWTIFQEIVDNLKKRKILQGEFTLAIAPKALHVKLWAEWWDIYGRGFALEEFTRDLAPTKPTKLIEWFHEMFQYAAASGVASTVAKDLLGPKGPFQMGNYLRTSLGSNFFLALTEADPKSALDCLKETVETWDRETLLQYKEGRTYVVLALQKIAVRRALFADAARLLLALGEAENSRASNNASGVFVELFSLGRGKVAPTKASPADRFPILHEAFESGSKERRRIALRACNFALKSGFISRIQMTGYQGLEPEPETWMPETYGELWDAYKRVWQLLSEQLAHLPEEERKDGAEVLLNHAREIGRIPVLTDMVVDTVATIAKKMYVSEKRVIKVANSILYYEGKELLAKTRRSWEQLLDGLVCPDFPSMMQRYVGMDLLEDKFDEDRNRVDQAQPQIEKLVQQAVNVPSLLQSELTWLVTVEAKKGYQFGHELGKKDDGFTLLPILLDAQRNAEENASVAFLSGYFRAIFESNEEKWEKQLDALVDDSNLNRLIPELTSRSGLTNRAGSQVLDLAERNIIGVNDFGIFSYGRAIESLSDEVFTAWIEFLLSVSDKSAVSIALDLYDQYYDLQKTETALPYDLTFRLLSHPSLFEESDRYRFDTMTDYYWTKIAKAFLDLCPEERLSLVRLMLSHFGNHGAIVGVYLQTCSVLDEMATRYPAEVWHLVSEFLEDRTNYSRTIALEQWLREGSFSAGEDAKGGLTRIPRKKIWEWVDEDVDNRVSYLTPCIPKTHSVEEWMTSLTRAFLVRYGTCENGGSTLMEIYSVRGGHGLPSSQLKGIIQTLLQIRDSEDNEYVRSRIDESVKEFEMQIERERLHEERRFC